jgi:hypothetical protein
MKDTFITVILAFMGLSLVGQQLESFSVVIIPNNLTLAGTGELDADGFPKQGADYTVTGYIYPGDYLENHCPDSLNCGILEDGKAEHHNEAVGRWDFGGFTTMDLAEAFINGGTPTFSTQLFMFRRDFADCPECKINTEGRDVYGGSQNVWFKRSISGSTTKEFRIMRGDVEQIIYQQPENKNETGGYNMKVTFRFYKN